MGRVRLKQSFEDKSVTFEFERAATPAILVNAVPLEIKGYENNPYRRSGMIVDLAAFRALLNRPDNNTVTIHYQH